MRNKLPFRTCVCQRLTCTDVGDNVRRSIFGSEEAIHGPNERLDYRSACRLRSQKVKSGRYNNASEVVREALRRMEEEDERALRLAKPTAEEDRKSVV